MEFEIIIFANITFLGESPWISLERKFHLFRIMVDGDENQYATFQKKLR